MANFFEAFEGASENDKLAREAWAGGQWVPAPAAIGSRLDIEALVLTGSGGATGDHWQRRMEDMAEDDWVVIP